MANKKTPSPKVIASAWVLKQLNPDEYAVTLTPAELTAILDSSVSSGKRDKVLAQIGKITGKFQERLRKTVDKFHGTAPAAAPAPKKAKKAKAETGD